MRLACLALLALLACARPAAPPPAAPTAAEAPAALQADLDRLADAFGRDRVGIAVHDLGAGWTAGVNLDRAFPQHSVFKLWIAVAVAAAIDRGELRWDEELFVGPDDLDFPYQPIAADAGPDGRAFPVRDLVRRMVTQSDNPSADVLIRRLGGPAAVQAAADRAGVTGVRVALDERGMHDADDRLRAEVAALGAEEARALVRARLAADPNGATPRGTALGLAALHRGALLSSAQTREVLAMLAATATGADRLKAGLPAGWTIAHKTGTGGEAAGLALGTNDAGLIAAPDGRVLAIAAFVAGTERPPEERAALLGDVARAAAR